MPKVNVRFIRAVSLGAKSYRAGDTDALDGPLAQQAIEGKVAVAEKVAPEAAVRKAPETAAKPSAKAKAKK